MLIAEPVESMQEVFQFLQRMHTEVVNNATEKVS
jgi:hypothetical protein